MQSTDHRSRPGTATRAWLDRSTVPRRPTDVHEARRALDAVTDRLLAEGDPRAAFPDVYGIITRRVAESVELCERQGGEAAFFREPQWISRLAGRFCERYLETRGWSLGGSGQDAGAWDATYGALDHAGTFPLQHVLLGLSAHINFDLAIGIHRTIVEVGPTDAATLRRYKHDHDAVNDLLRASIPEAFDHLISRHRCEASALILRRTYAVAEWAAMRILSSWRARVWDDAMALLAAPTAAAREAIVQRMERLSRRYARILVLPGALPLGLHAPARATARWIRPRPADRWQARGKNLPLGPTLTALGRGSSVGEPSQRAHSLIGGGWGTLSTSSPSGGLGPSPIA